MALKDEKHREMILKGNLMKTVLMICLPLAVYQFFNSCYTLVDQIICANISTTAQNAVSSIGQIKNAFSAFGAGLAAGGAVLVSRYYGAGNVKDARYASSNLFFLSIVLSGILMLIFIPLAEPIMRLCQIAEDSIRIGVSFFQLQLLELGLVALNSVFIGLEKAKGNSKLIFFLNLVVLGVKIAFTCLFIYGCHLEDIVFVEVASIIGQASLTGFALYTLFKRNNILRISFKMILPKKCYLIPILKLSLPIFLGKFVMNLGKVTVNGICGMYWNNVTNGLIVGTLGVSNNICGLITSPTNCFEDGESSIVSQNLGNRNLKRALKTFSKTLIAVAVISLVGYVLTGFVLIDYLVELFARNKTDKNADLYKQMIKEIFVYDSLSIPALGLNAAVLGLLYGFGKTGLSTVLNLSRIGTRIIVLVVLHTLNPELSATYCAGLSMGISNIVILVLSLVFLAIFFIHLKRKGYKGMQLSDPEPEVQALVY